MSTSMVIPTGACLLGTDGRWQAMKDWLTANRFDISRIPLDALIVIRDGSCLGVDQYTFDAQGRLIGDQETGEPPRRVEWHPMTQAPPAILLPIEGWSS